MSFPLCKWGSAGPCGQSELTWQANPRGLSVVCTAYYSYNSTAGAVSSADDKLTSFVASVRELDPHGRQAMINRQCAGSEELRSNLSALLYGSTANAPALVSTTCVSDDASRSADGEAARPLAMGDLVGQYVILQVLGEGGMGVVYRARDRKLDRYVAMKFLRSKGPTSTKRFQLEAQATARCTHKNIVVIHDVSEYRGQPYLVLEYIKGQTLRQWMQRQQDTVPAQRAVQLMTPVVRALAAAHNLGIVHRDLKPENSNRSRAQKAG